MPTYSQIQRNCDQLNRIERRVNETRTVSLQRYWEAACEYNFAITFGRTAIMREQALIMALRALRRHRRGLIVVISGSGTLERQIFANIGRNGLGRIWRPTPESGYDVFSGMEPIKIQEIIRTIGQHNMPFSVGPMTAFADAFLAVISRAGSSRLSEMLLWAGRTDEELEWAAQRQGLADYYRNSIRVNATGGMDMRMILSWLRDAFSDISTSDCNTGANITTLAGEDALIFLPDRSSMPDIFRLAIMKELEAVVNRGSPLTIVLDGVEPTQNNYVRELVRYAMQHINVRLGLCGSNIWAMMQPNQEQILGPIRSWVVFSTGGQQADDLLARFGSYHYHFPALTSGSDRLFTANYSEATEERHRIRTQDLSQFAVLLSGHAGEYLELSSHFE